MSQLDSSNLIRKVTINKVVGVFTPMNIFARYDTAFHALDEALFRIEGYKIGNMLRGNEMNDLKYELDNKEQQISLFENEKSSYKKIINKDSIATVKLNKNLNWVKVQRDVCAGATVAVLIWVAFHR